MKLFKEVVILGLCLIAFSVKSQNHLEICSWNIQWLGNYTKKDNNSIADYLSKYDIVVIQELVATPFTITCSDGTIMKEDKQASEFFASMKKQGFNYSISNEDTGSPKSGKPHSNGSSTEFFAVFYKENKVAIDSSLANEYIDSTLFRNPIFTRVPHAFSFSTNEGNDFTLISVHLTADDSEQEKRKTELEGIYTWIERNDSVEKDFIILGDFNLKDKIEHDNVLCNGCSSLNYSCEPSSLGGKPYEHVFYNAQDSKEIDSNSFEILNMKLIFKNYWTSEEEYPIDDNNLFRQLYSDHNPMIFKILVTQDDD